MRIAVTKHAVDRFRERVEGAKGFQEESIRRQVRKIVEDGLRLGVVKDHPLVANRRVVPFKSGETVLFLSIGPNTTDYEAEMAVIGVLFEKEVSEGKVGLGIQLGDLFPALQGMRIGERKPRFIVFVGPVGTTVEKYLVENEKELRSILNTRAPKHDEVSLYGLID
jgi:hypothetical protein